MAGENVASASCVMEEVESSLEGKAVPGDPSCLSSSPPAPGLDLVLSLRLGIEHDLRARQRGLRPANSGVWGRNPTYAKTSPL